MADIFLSYRNTEERRALVKRLAVLLHVHGVSVWWDYGLEAGESFRSQVADELARARIVAPLWCAESVVSKWVAMEAELGKDKLLPVRLQKVAPPAEFEAIQAADLVGWNGDVQSPRVLEFVRKICERLGASSRAPVYVMEELSELPELAPLPDVTTPSGATAAPSGQDHVLADLRHTWSNFPARRDDVRAMEQFLERVRRTAPGSGLEFEVERALSARREREARRVTTADEWLARLESEHGVEGARFARRLAELLRTIGYEVRPVESGKSLRAIVKSSSGRPATLFYIWVTSASMDLGHLGQFPPFQSDEARLELFDVISALPSSSVVNRIPTALPSALWAPVATEPGWSEFESFARLLKAAVETGQALDVVSQLFV